MLRFRLGNLTCVTGVSGSGKSTLVKTVLFNALSKLKGQPQEPAGDFDSLLGEELIDHVVLVDQSPIGKTTRSNPASYVGALDAIRKLFAKEPLAVERNYTAGTFSFNAGTGRCPTCSGNGFEHVEMQFLSDVYLRCPECDGKRFRPEVREVKFHAGDRALSISDVLDLTVSDAVELFDEHPEVERALSPLISVGLGYLTLGQPVPSLSGGEAQRLKLAGFLAKSTKGSKARTATPKNGTLFIFDEPTTGLHFEDIGKLIATFQTLLNQGHSVLVVEHHLDMIVAADHIIDLGPEGGEAGGQIVATGTPSEIAATTTSITGQMLRQHEKQNSAAVPAKQRQAVQRDANNIHIHNAREHNLKNIDITIPRQGFTVVTGVSGSGKSTVAFDILFAEGQRRYLESLNAYARQFVQPAARPDVDAIWGIAPTVAIEQRTSRGGRKSTVATLTELYHFLRLLFVKLGEQYCPDCDVSVEPQSVDNIVASTMKQFRNQSVELFAPLVVSRKGYYTDLAKWAKKKGFLTLRVDGEITRD